VLKEKTKEAETKEIKEEPKQKRRPVKKKFVFGLIVALLFAGGIATAVLWYMNKDIVARVGGDVITREDLNRALYSEDFKGSVESPTKVSSQREKEIINEMVDNLLIKKQAAADGISVSSEELEKVIAERGMNSSAYTPVQKEIARENIKMELLKKKFIDSQFGWKSGEFLLYRFDKFMSEIANPNNQNKDSEIQEHKTYAKQLADNAYQKMAAGQLTMTDLSTELYNDKKIGPDALEPYHPNLWSSFGQSNYTEEQGYFDNITYPSFKQRVAALKKGINEPILLQDLKNGQKRDIAYALVVIKEEKGGKYNGNFKGWLEQQRKDRKIKQYSTDDPFYKKINIISKASAVDCSTSPATKQTPGAGELTPLNIFVKYKKADGTLANVTKSMGMKFDYKSRDNIRDGYNSAQHSFIRTYDSELNTSDYGKDEVGRTMRNLCDFTLTDSGVIRLQGPGGDRYKINCGYVKYIDIFFTDPTISGAASGGSWTIKDIDENRGQPDEWWVNFKQNATDNTVVVHPFCYWTSAAKTSCDTSPHGFGVHYPNGDIINFQMIYTPKYIVNGACGSANGTSRITAPVTDAELCTVGTKSAVAGTGPWTWTCNGINGGSTASCKADKTVTCQTPTACGVAFNTCNSGTAANGKTNADGSKSWDCVPTDKYCPIVKGCYLPPEGNNCKVPTICGTSYAGQCVNGTGINIKTNPNGSSQWDCQPTDKLCPIVPNCRLDAKICKIVRVNPEPKDNTITVKDTESINLSITPDYVPAGGTIYFDPTGNNNPNEFISGPGPTLVVKTKPYYSTYGEEFKAKVWVVADEYGNTVDVGGACERIITIKVQVEANCTLSPTTGIAPLPVKAVINRGTPPYYFNMENKKMPARDNPVLYYTYTKAGTYDVFYKDATMSEYKACSQPTVTVRDPKNSRGNEVAP
jgi:hypothetical protein